MRKTFTARKYGPKVRFGKDASDFFAFVSLDFDLAIFHRAASSTGLLHRPGQALFSGRPIPTNPFTTVTVLPPRPAFCRMMSTRPRLFRGLS